MFDLIVIGGGHAGIEAALAAARMGCAVGLVTGEAAAIGRMSCNPAIGGTAKGHLVHEIDALGGVMGELADATGIQFRLLNRSKGPAIWSSRCQSDRDAYAAAAQRMVAGQRGLAVVEAMVTGVVVRAGRIAAVTTDAHGEIGCRALVVASGTFLNGVLYTGLNGTAGGRFGERPAGGLSEAFRHLGLKTGRLKTGTPPRLRRASIDFSVTSEQPGDADPAPFSGRTDARAFPRLPQVSCHITFTNPATHEILATGFDRSPMFTGRIRGAGPRYCPSIEDKVVRFADRDRHQLFLEPEGLDSDLVYLNGFSSSLPAEVQLAALRTVPGLERVQVARYGYAVEYDFFPAYQVDATLESKLVRGLYFAGQVNGTSGYEEAAAQGLMAGINAALSVRGGAREELVLRRDEAYVGVLIDDLVTKPSHEPYRMFTSRAEYRLALRQDNARRRLSAYGHELGLVGGAEMDRIRRRQGTLDAALTALRTTSVAPAAVNRWLRSLGVRELQHPETVAALCRRPEVRLQGLLAAAIPALQRSQQRSQQHGLTHAQEHAQWQLRALLADPEVLSAAEVELKYEGYIDRERRSIERLKRFEALRIPVRFDYQAIDALSRESREKLALVRPRTLGQASRISGVRPADISVLLVQLRARQAPAADGARQGGAANGACQGGAANGARQGGT